MSGYREFKFWSPLLGGDAVRLSIADTRGGEFFAVIAVEHGTAFGADGNRVPKYRVDRDAALDAIEAAIVARREPGEVVI